MTSGVRLAKVTGKVLKNVGIVAASAIVTGIFTKKSKNAVNDIVTGGVQIYNILANMNKK